MVREVGGAAGEGTDSDTAGCGWWLHFADPELPLHLLDWASYASRLPVCWKRPGEPMVLPLLPGTICSRNNGHLEMGMFFVLLCFKKKSRNFWVDRKREWHLVFIARKSVFLTGGTWRVPVRSLWVNKYHSVYVGVWVTLWAKWKPSRKAFIPLFTQCLAVGGRQSKYAHFFPNL